MVDRGDGAAVGREARLAESGRSGVRRAEGAIEDGGTAAAKGGDEAAVVRDVRLEEAAAVRWARGDDFGGIGLPVVDEDVVAAVAAQVGRLALERDEPPIGGQGIEPLLLFGLRTRRCRR